eukprot:scaffold138786_cov31-Tisochrysis_lutea.AAC.1
MILHLEKGPRMCPVPTCTKRIHTGMPAWGGCISTPTRRPPPSPSLLFRIGLRFGELAARRPNESRSSVKMPGMRIGAALHALSFSAKRTIWAPQNSQRATRGSLGCLMWGEV